MIGPLGDVVWTARCGLTGQFGRCTAPEGRQFAPWDGPAALMLTDYATASTQVSIAPCETRLFTVGGATGAGDWGGGRLPVATSTTRPPSSETTMSAQAARAPGWRGVSVSGRG